MFHWFKQCFARGRGPIHSIGGAAIVIGVAGIASRLLGLLRDRLLAARFGAGDTLDAYYAAFRIPDLVYGLLIAGALSAALVPVFTEVVSKRGKERAWTMISDFLTLLGGALGVLTIFFFIFAPEIVAHLVPGFTGAKRELTIHLTRIMLLSPIFFGVSAVVGSVLVSSRRFLDYSIAPLLYNLGIILGITVLVDRFGEAGLGYGVVLGAALHLALQWRSVAADGFRFRPRLSAWRDRSVRRVLRLMIPRSLGMAVSQVSLLVVAFFASTLVSGSLAVFTFAGNLQAVPLGLFGVAFSLAVFPSLSKFAAEGELNDFFRLLARTTRRILFFVLPVSMLFIVLRAQIVRVILGSGQFNWDDTRTTFQVLGILAISLFAQSLVQLFARAFFALQNTWIPLIVAVLSEAVQIVIIVSFIHSFDVYALALAFVAANIVNFLLLYLFLRRELGSAWQDRKMLWPAWKIVVASAGAGLSAQAAKTWFGFNLSPLDTFVSVFSQAAVTTIVATAVFVLLSVWMRIEEFENLKNFLWHKVLGRPGAIATEQSVEL